MIEWNTAAKNREELEEKLKHHREHPKDTNAIMDCWMMLADAICMSGIHDNDRAFLNSKWYEYLKEMLINYNDYRSNQSNYIVRIV